MRLSTLFLCLQKTRAWKRFWNNCVAETFGTKNVSFFNSDFQSVKQMKEK